MIHNRWRIKGLVATIALLFSILALSFMTGRQSLYVDIVNGEEKLVRETLGWTYSVTTNATAYSLLVDRLGLRDKPDWRLADREEMRDLFDSEHTCFKAGKSLVAMEALALHAELDEIDDLPGAIRQLRLLLQAKDTMAVPKFMQNLSSQRLETLNSRKN